MFLINITFALCIIGTIFLAIGIDIKGCIHELRLLRVDAAKSINEDKREEEK